MNLMAESVSHKRIMKELTLYAATTEQLEKSGTEQTRFIIYDESYITTMYGVIIGPEDTPYEGGFYLIQMKIPTKYPFIPPECTYLNICGKRQSPNLYEEGKICLSLINTWDTPTWKPCESMEQILLSIQALVLTENPLDCEPPYDYSVRNPHLATAYKEIVRFLNFRHNMYNLWHVRHPLLPESCHEQLKEIIAQHISKHYERYLKILVKMSICHNGKLLSCSMYPSVKDIKTNYSEVLRDFIKFLELVMPDHLVSKVPELVKTFQLEFALVAAGKKSH